jgi:hypothetical protein
MSATAPTPALATLLVLSALALAPLAGCFIVVEEEDSSTEPLDINHTPTIIAELTWWTCEFSPSVGEYYFEFQAVVDDLDGWSDVSDVNIYFFEPSSASVLDSYSMHYEGEGVWGGLVWEDESLLFCGDATDAIIEAWDYFDANDFLEINF